MRYLLFFTALLLCHFTITAQENVEGSFDFQTESAKEYAIYVPSNYNEDSPNALMVGLHPLNTSRWDAISWRDTLQVFAEENNLILLCPDGGPDGAIDDPIDTAFTSFMLDTIQQWYNIDPSEIYLMGFSWGGKTTYSYGLRRPHIFKGYMAIGAAISGSNELAPFIDGAAGKNFSIIHGSSDIPNSRYFPAVEALTNVEACLSDTLMNGIGHTIDFPNRNQILSDAFQHISGNNCELTSSNLNIDDLEFSVYPNPNDGSFIIDIDPALIHSLKLFNTTGQQIPFTMNGSRIKVDSEFSGLHYLIINDGASQTVKRMMIL